MLGLARRSAPGEQGRPGSLVPLEGDVTHPAGLRVDESQTTALSWQVRVHPHSRPGRNLTQLRHVQHHQLCHTLCDPVLVP